LHRFHVLRHSCDRLLLTHLRQQAARLRIDWQVVREAMAPSWSRDWNNLLRLVSMVAPAIEAELLAATQPVLLAHPGLLARYGQMGLWNAYAIRLAAGCLPRPVGPGGGR